MKKIIFILIIGLGLSGCATKQLAADYTQKSQTANSKKPQSQGMRFGERDRAR